MSLYYFNTYEELAKNTHAHTDARDTYLINGKGQKQRERGRKKVTGEEQKRLLVKQLLRRRVSSCDSVLNCRSRAAAVVDRRRRIVSLSGH